MSYVSVVSVIELECSAVDPKASPEPSAGCVTRPDPVERPLNSIRSHSANSSSQPGGLNEHIFYSFLNLLAVTCLVALTKLTKGIWGRASLVWRSSWRPAEGFGCCSFITWFCEQDWRLQRLAHSLAHNAVFFFSPPSIGALPSFVSSCWILIRGRETKRRSDSTSQAPTNTAGGNLSSPVFKHHSVRPLRDETANWNTEASCTK